MANPKWGMWLGGKLFHSWRLKLLVALERWLLGVKKERSAMLIGSRVLKLPTASCEDCASAVGVPCKVEHVAADPVTPRWQDEEAVLI